MPTSASRRAWSKLFGDVITMCSYVAEHAAGLTDADVVELSMREGRLLLTEDKDFGDLIFRRGRTVPGIVLMRPTSYELESA